jgi:ribosome maturation factor RimP
MSDKREQTLAEIERIAREVASNLGLEVVEIVFHRQGRHSLLRIDIDRPGTIGVGIADCESLSRALDEHLEGIPFVESSYQLQVSSPGIDRPIRSDDEIRRNTGRQVRVTFEDEAGKVRELTGTLDGLDGESAVRVAGDRGDVSISRAAIVLMKQDVTTRGRKRNE